MKFFYFLFKNTCHMGFRLCRSVKFFQFTAICQKNNVQCINAQLVKW